MKAHLTTDQIDDYVARTISRSQFAHVHHHIFKCELCYQRFLNQFEANKEWPIEIDFDELSGLNEWHLQGEELRAYAEGKIEKLDRDFASLHLEKCDWCREELFNFTEFNDKLSYYLSKRHRPVKRLSTWDRYFPHLNSISKPVQWIGVSVLGLLFLSSLALVWISYETNLSGESSSVQERTVEEAVLPDETSPLLQSTDIASVDAAPPSSKTSTTSPHPARQASGREKTLGTPNEVDSATDILARDLIRPSVIDLFDRSSVVLRGNGSEDESFNVINPYCTVIREEQPTFQWMALSGASNYLVSVYDKHLRLVTTSEPLEVTRWKIPVQLRRRELYTWIVTAHKDNKEIIAPSLPARAEFMIMAQTDLASLNRKLKSVSSQLARAIIYAEAGLLDDAERETQAYLSINPYDECSKQLLSTIRSWRKN
jgi:hypothetical protein